ncbi:MAG: methionyl-tRNA formyltransferase [Desulfuromonadaceae bacterium]|nr:methionyl-tRNA formyltransferase [Desulfuromonadaceae bacterium]
MKPLRIIFMGTPDFACPTLQKLIDRGEEIIAVITQPDRPKGRGQKLMPPPVKELAEKHTIPTYQPLKVRDPAFIELLSAMQPGIIVVVAFGQILPKALLDIPKYGCVNVHASLLPKYRGAAPLNWCIINGEHETGVTTMMMDVGLDTGDMLLSEKTELNENEDIASLHDRMSIMGADLLARTLDLLVIGNLAPEKQNNDESCYAPMLKKDDGIINWNNDARTIHNLVRGLAVWPVACSTIDGQTLKIYRTLIGEGTGKPGTVLQASKGFFEIACQSGSLFLLEVQLAGKKRLDCASFLSGYQVQVGAMLGASESEEKE